MKLQDRIKSFRRVPASDLKPNPRNWRTHPTAQADALRGILAEVGIANAVIARETPDGLELLDGHLRAEIAVDAMLQCLIVDVTDEEAEKLRATMDTVTGMAEADPDKLAELLDDLEVTSDAMRAMLDDLAQETGIKPPDFAPVSADEQGRLDERMVSERGWNYVFSEKRAVVKPSECEVIHLPGKFRYLLPLDDEMRQRIEPLRKPYPKISEAAG